MKTRQRQTTLDIALEVCGNIEDAFALCEANGWALTDTPEVGVDVTEIEPTTTDGRNVAALYRGGQTMPATAIDEDEGTRVGGIGYMGIETDFRVS